MTYHTHLMLFGPICMHETSWLTLRDSNWLFAGSFVCFLCLEKTNQDITKLEPVQNWLLGLGPLWVELLFFCGISKSPTKKAWSETTANQLLVKPCKNTSFLGFSDKMDDIPISTSRNGIRWDGPCFFWTQKKFQRWDVEKGDISPSFRWLVISVIQREIPVQRLPFSKSWFKFPCWFQTCFWKHFFQVFSHFLSWSKFESNFSNGLVQPPTSGFIKPCGFHFDLWRSYPESLWEIPPESRKTPSLLSLKCMVKPTTTHTASLLRPRFFFPQDVCWEWAVCFNTPGGVVWTMKPSQWREIIRPPSWGGVEKRLNQPIRMKSCGGFWMNLQTVAVFVMDVSPMFSLCLPSRSLT